MTQTMITAANGKTYAVEYSNDFRTGYCATRDGQPFGPIRHAYPNAKPGTVGREIRDVAERTSGDSGTGGGNLSTD
jgi:hypothetical protein